MSNTRKQDDKHTPIKEIRIIDIYAKDLTSALITGNNKEGVLNVLRTEEKGSSIYLCLSWPKSSPFNRLYGCEEYNYGAIELKPNDCHGDLFFLFSLPRGKYVKKDTEEDEQLFLEADAVTNQLFEDCNNLIDSYHKKVVLDLEILEKNGWIKAGIKFSIEMSDGLLFNETEEKNILSVFSEDFLTSIKNLSDISRKERTIPLEFINLIFELKTMNHSNSMSQKYKSEKLEKILLVAKKLEAELKSSSFWYKAAKCMYRILSCLTPIKTSKYYRLIGKGSSNVAKAGHSENIVENINSHKKAS